MDGSSASNANEPLPTDVEAMRDLAFRGLNLDVLARAAKYAPFEEWRNPRACRLAAWLCWELGAPKRAQRLATQIFRRSPRSALGRLTRVHLTAMLRGPVAALDTLRSTQPFGDDATDEDRVQLLLQEAGALTGLRDFERAHVVLEAAARGGALAHRVRVVTAKILVAEDRFADARREIAIAASLAPDDPEVIEYDAHLRLLVGDDAGALDLLRSGATRTQAADLAMQLVAILGERREYDERHQWIERWSERVPLLEDPERLTLLRADSAYDRGDFREALRLSRGAKAPFHRRVAEHLARTIDDGGAKLVHLNVPFVRQHHMTCAPATLSAIASYWGKAANHLEVAEAICYDGTPKHGQRAWAESHDYVARELTVTWDSARALLDRGVPFTVTTVESASAHLQAIVGYDERRGTLLIRDPFVPLHIEALAEEWIERWRATGPHGMVIVPREEAARLDGIELLDEALHDGLHELQTALERHDRAAATVARDCLTAAAPAHVVAIASRRAIAAYDQDATQVLACALEHAAAFPKFAAAHLEALHCMRSVRSRDERIAVAERLWAAHPDEPLYAEAVARELLDDAREHPRAARLLRRVFQKRFDRHVALSLLAEIAWGARDRERSLSFRRFAASLGRFDEGAAYAYFTTSRALGKEKEGLAFLEARARSLGALRSGPVHTLVRAFDALGTPAEGMRALKAAFEAHPEDGDLMLFAAEAHAVYGDLTEAKALLERAKSHCKLTAWLRVAAQVELRTGSNATRRAFLEDLIALEPLDVEAQLAHASCVAAMDGLIASRAALEAAWKRAPYLRGLSMSYVESLDGAGAHEVESASRKVLALDPTNAWVHRQLTLALVTQGRLADARRAFGDAEAVAPHDASLEMTRAFLLQHEGRLDEARAALFAGLEIDPDRTEAIAQLSASAADAREREGALDGIERIVLERSVTGAGIHAWYMAVRGVRDAAWVQGAVDRARQRRAEHWVPWSCAVRQLCFVGDPAGAMALAAEACDRFPLLAPLWTVRAEAANAAGLEDEAASALERASRIDPFHEETIAAMSAACARRGSTKGARELLERAIARKPTSARLRRLLAALEWSSGSHEAALAVVEAALDIDPYDVDTWQLLDEWDLQRGRRPEIRARIEGLCTQRPWSALAMLCVARAKASRDDGDGALQAVAGAIAVDPLCIDAHDFRASLLAMLERWDEAEAACAPDAFRGRIPRELRGRAAWVKARRGDLAGACDAMRALLEEHRGYAWGWSMLAEWSSERGDLDASLAAAIRTAAAAPGVAAAQRGLAAAHFRVGDRAAGGRALASAVDAAPSDERAVIALLEHHLEERDLEAARSLLPLLTNLRPAAARAAEARVHAAAGDVGAALQSLAVLVRDTRAELDDLLQARRACILAGAADPCDELFTNELEREDASGAVGRVWARTRVGRDDAKGLQKALAGLPLSEALRAAALEAMIAYAERDATALRRELATLVQKRFTPCGDALWAQVANALITAGQFSSAAAWTRDWKARPEAQPWMLLNRASALRELEEYHLAFEVVEHAAALTPPDVATRSHRVWLAFELALDGQTTRARKALTDAGDLKNAAVVETVGDLADAMISLQEARSFGQFGAARSQLAAAQPACRLAVLERAHARASTRIAKDAGPAGALWLHRSTIGVFLAVVGVIALFALLVSSGVEMPQFTSFPTVLLIIFIIRGFMNARRNTG